MAGDDWRRYLRRDVSAVEPLGAYAAKRCPVRTQWDVIEPGDRAPSSPFMAMLAERGDEHEGDVVQELAAARDVARIPSGDAERRATATLAAMREGAALIADGRLPTDEGGRRVGEPDLLVRHGDAPVDGRWRYLPVDIKSHGALRMERGAAVVHQDLADIAAPAGEPTLDGRRDGTARGDTLQLAHYHRMIEACGHAVEDAPWGAIIGTERRVVWYPLDEPMWRTPTSDPDVATKRRTSLEHYDFEFGFRLDIAAAAAAQAQDPDEALLVEPVACGECPDSPWRRHCWPILESKDDVSLLPGVYFDEWRAFGDAGIDTIAGVVAAEGPVVGLTTARFEQIRAEAAARVADAPALPRHARVVVPAADVEVDVDMENVEDGAYLWGAWVSLGERAAVLGTDEGYRAFATWESPLNDEAAGQNFGAFWRWLTDLRTACAEHRLSIQAYCWSQSAENQHLRHGASVLGVEDEVELFIGSDQWLDLLAWFKDSYVTGHANGLKTVATLLGFAWRDDDPGGAASMTWHVNATSEDGDTEAWRERLLAYNEDDVRATLHVRRWASARQGAPENR